MFIQLIFASLIMFLLVSLKIRNKFLLPIFFMFLLIITIAFYNTQEHISIEPVSIDISINGLGFAIAVFTLVIFIIASLFWDRFLLVYINNICIINKDGYLSFSFMGSRCI